MLFLPISIEFEARNEMSSKKSLISSIFQLFLSVYLEEFSYPHVKMWAPLSAKSCAVVMAVPSIAKESASVWSAPI